MNLLMDLEGRLLYREDIEELLKTDKGKALLKEYMLSGKIAYAAQELFNYLTELDKKPSEMTSDEIQNCCQVVYWSIKYAKWDAVEKYLRQAVSKANEENFNIPVATVH